MTPFAGVDLLPGFGPTGITAAEFERFSTFLRDATGIELKEGKEQLVVGRLDRRLRHHGLTTFTEYFALITSKQGGHERRIAIDLLTTNETYFFREPQHFVLLARLASELGPYDSMRVWSAASSTGEEACSIAMTLHDLLGPDRYRVLATDVSSRAVAAARRGLYRLPAAENIPRDLLKAYCLRGSGDHEGTMAVHPSVRAQIRFATMNLTQPLPDVGEFDVVFLRNVLIYFSAATKKAVIGRLLETLRPGGTFLVGHAETLTGLGIPGLEHVSPSVYRRARG